MGNFNRALIYPNRKPKTSSILRWSKNKNKPKLGTIDIMGKKHHKLFILFYVFLLLRHGSFFGLIKASRLGVHYMTIIRIKGISH
jgi:hypothetical protein